MNRKQFLTVLQNYVDGFAEYTGDPEMADPNEIQKESGWLRDFTSYIQGPIDGEADEPIAPKEVK